MVEMTFDKYDELMEKFEEMPNSLHDYGITREDMAKMDSNPDKYLQFAMYLSTRPWYEGKGDNTHTFINSDALKPVDAAFLLKEFINANICFCDDEDEEFDADETEAMKKLLNLN